MNLVTGAVLIVFGTSRETSDFWADCLWLWWERVGRHCAGLKRLRIRFASRFWPDDVLTISAKVTDRREGQGEIDCEFTCVNQAGEVIIRGDATAKLR